MSTPQAKIEIANYYLEKQRIKDQISKNEMRICAVRSEIDILKKELDRLKREKPFLSYV